MGGKAGGEALGGLDADGEGGVVRRVVVAHHRRQPELGAALAGERQAHQPTRMGDHEVDVGRLDQLGGHDQVALVLAVLVVDDHDHAPGAQFFERSEEHTSELQSLMRISYAVFCLKKKKAEYKNIIKHKK